MLRRLKSWPWLRIAAAALLVLAVALSVANPFTSGVGWIAAGLAFVASIVLSYVVHRHGGWHLLGPHFYYDVVRLARRGRSTALRVVYILALFAGLALVYENTPAARDWRLNDLARVSEKFAFALFLIQNIAVMVLAPAYLGSAIAEERERRTLELLFTTQLNNTEIILGKLTSRIIHLVGFVLAGVPILSVIQFWGGIDMLLIAGNLLNTLLNILSIGSFCLLVSVLARTVTGAVMSLYALILPIGFCCMGLLRGFPFVLQDARSGGAGNITVQDLGVLCIIHLLVVAGFLSLAVVALREHEMVAKMRGLAPQTGVPKAAPPDLMPISEPPGQKRQREPENEFSIPYTLPPVTDNAMLWKERYVGGPPWFFSPVVLVPALPFLVTGLLVFGFGYVPALFLSHEQFREAAETWAIVLRYLYYVCLAAYVLGVGFHAASSVARERQQQTLDPLLLLPIDRSEILWAKLLGSLWRGWPWLGLMLGNVVLGTLMGAYHPFSTVVLCIAPWALILFFAGLGLMLSVVMSTVLRANLILLIVVILLVACMFVLPFGLSPLTYLEPFVFSFWGDVGHERHGFHDGFRDRSDYRLGGAIVFFLYLAGAAIFLKTAFVQFENRSRPSASR